jgi:hypothetical protein
LLARLREALEDKKYMDEKEQIWREIDKDIDLYKFYLELVIKSAIFVFGITGGITSYYFAHENKPLIQYSLILPVIMNTGFFLICVFSIKFSEALREDHYVVCEKVGVTAPYEMSPLSNVLRIFSTMYGLCALGMLTLFIKNVF